LIENLDHWPIESNSVDLAFADYVVEHVTNPDSFFSEARRVLKPGGYLCLRTPNSLSYIALIARMIPNRMHSRVTKVAQQGREEKDVFPTVYKCNRPRTLRRQLRKSGFECVVLQTESEPGYLNFSPLAFRIGVIWHAICPPMFRSTLQVFARKV